MLVMPAQTVTLHWSVPPPQPAAFTILAGVLEPFNCHGYELCTRVSASCTAFDVSVAVTVMGSFFAPAKAAASVTFWTLRR